MVLSRLRLVAINDVYELSNLPKLQTFLSQLSPIPNAVLLSGDFLSPSSLSSIDGGRGMVATLRATGITHFCLGNHEADVQLSTLKARIQELTKSSTWINTNMRKPPESASWMSHSPISNEYSIVRTSDDRVKVGLLGMMSDEDNVFRDETFKGVPISNVLDTYSSIYNRLVPGEADLIIPMTHQSIVRDRQLAERMVETIPSRGVILGSGLIIGGHEHTPIDETITLPGKDKSVRILKAGTEAQHASLIDLSFDTTDFPPVLKSIESTLVDLSVYNDSVVVKEIADSHMALLDNMDSEVVVEVQNLPPGKILSSERTRFKQTTVGSYFCQAIKEELEVDVAIINGGTIKGGASYPQNQISYAQLKKELPFPTKIVVIEMTRQDLQDAIHYSRSHIEEGMVPNQDGEYERRGYLQVDLDFDLDMHTGDQSGIIKVALPRNLMAGFCKIQPLVDYGKQLKEQGKYPDPDDFIPALDLVVRHSCKNRWFEILHQRTTFADLDLNNDGVLDRYEVKKMMEKFLGHEPPDFVVDNMIASLDADENGVVDVGELSYLVATMEREEQWRKF